MSAITTTKPVTTQHVNTVCVAAEDMGVMTTKYGAKPMVKFTFESEEVNEFGSKRRYTRLFHNHTHPMSALSEAVKSWCNRDLGAEEESDDGIDFSSFVGMTARLTLEPGTLKDGKRFQNIAWIKPVNECELVAPCEAQAAE